MKKSRKQLADLLYKFSTNTCSQKEFDEWCNALGNEDKAAQLNGVLKERWDRSQPVISQKSVYLQWYAGVAAAVILVALALPFIMKQQTHVEQFDQFDQKEVASTTPFATSVTHIVLSDGSAIALREGSRLNQSSDFEGNTREVSLDGEAYFDITSNPDKPFIIYTGNIKTTVLGTSFSIKAYSGDPEVVVTVTKGKVKVENEKKLLAVLEADNQLVYHISTHKSTEKVVDAQKEIDWRSHELLFKNKTFASIAEEIGRTYEITIEFESEALMNQLITASIDSRDPVEKILEMLCMSQRAGFTVENGIYKIALLQQQTPH